MSVSIALRGDFRPSGRWLCNTSTAAQALSMLAATSSRCVLSKAPRRLREHGYEEGDLGSDTAKAVHNPRAASRGCAGEAGR